MTLQYELLASAREAELEHQARELRLKGLIRYCRRRLLGIIRIAEPCPC